MLEGKLDLNKVVTYALIVLLGGSDIWQYIDFEDKIHRDTKVHSEVIYDSRVDSLIKALNGKNYAQGMLEAGAMEFKDLPQLEARKYMTKLFEVADEAIKHDSAWRFVIRPFVYELYGFRKDLYLWRDYKPLIPLQHKETKVDYFNSYRGLVPMFKRSNGLVGYSIDGDNKIIQHLSNIQDG